MEGIRQGNLNRIIIQEEKNWNQLNVHLATR